MNTREQSLFNTAGPSGAEPETPPVLADEKKNSIEINPKLNDILQKYIQSYKNINDQIELKGKLIDLIRKL